MHVSIISFTEKGILLSQRLAGLFGETECAIYTKCGSCCKEYQTVQFVTERIGEWAKERLEEGSALLFIGACGIAVRAIAPYLTDKMQDSPVLVMDEGGQYAIPLLSGHMGGANEMAVFIAEQIGAEPVITTATDVNRQFAVDLMAKKNGLLIVNREGIAKVSAKVLSGKTIDISVEPGHVETDVKLPKGIKMVTYPPLQKVDVLITSESRKFETAILLKPKEYVIGVGCRKGKEPEKIEAFISRHLHKAGILVKQVYGMASIDVKKNEPGLYKFARKEKIPFITYTAEELMRVEGIFHGSEFVKEKVLADNVCERAALKLCEPEGKLIYEKHAEDGMTIAIAKRDWRVSFNAKQDIRGRYGTGQGG